MNLLSIRIITENVKQLTDFYEHITKTKAVYLNENFAEVRTEAGTLAIGSTKTLQFFGGNEVAKAAQNKTVIIEFIVKDVDSEYQSLEAFLEPFLVQKPTTMPWGNRSLLFKDPDGNLVNFFTPVSPEAVKKFEGKLD